MKRKTIFILIMVVLAAVVLAACGGGGDSADNPYGSVSAGKRLFDSGGSTGVPCSSCHTTDGTELVGPSLDNVWDRAGERTDLSAEEYLRESIVDPQAHIVEGYEDETEMPATYGEAFSDEQINDLLGYLYALSQ